MSNNFCTCLHCAVLIQKLLKGHTWYTMPCVAMKNVKSPPFGQQLLGMRNDPPLITVVKSFKGERMHKYIHEVIKLTIVVSFWVKVKVGLLLSSRPHPPRPRPSFLKIRVKYSLVKDWRRLSCKRSRKVWKLSGANYGFSMNTFFIELSAFHYITNNKWFLIFNDLTTVAT